MRRDFVKVMIGSLTLSMAMNVYPINAKELEDNTHEVGALEVQEDSIKDQVQITTSGSIEVNDEDRVENKLEIGDGFTEEGLKYKVTGENEVEIATHQSTSIENLKLKDTVIKDGVEYRVTRIASEAFQGHIFKNKELTIPNSITSIGERVFFKSRGLEILNITSNLVSVRNNLLLNSGENKKIINLHLVDNEGLKAYATKTIQGFGLAENTLCVTGDVGTTIINNRDTAIYIKENGEETELEKGGSHTFGLVELKEQGKLIVADINKTILADDFQLEVDIDGEESTGEITYEVVDTEIIDIDEDGFVVIKKVGNTEFTVNKAGDSNYNKTSITCKANISLESSTITIENIDEIKNKEYGDLQFEIISSGGDPELKPYYESNNTDVIAVDQNGKATVVGVGSATITVSKKESHNYAEGKVQVIIKVEKGKQSNMNMDPIDDKIYGVSSDFDTISHGGSPDIQTEYESSKPDIIQVNKETGKAMIVGVGTTTITATKPSNNLYEAATVSQEVTVLPNNKDMTIEPIPDKTYGDIAFDIISDGGDPDVKPSYIVSQPGVIEVDLEGKATIVGAGTVVITVNKEATDNYEAAQATVVVNVLEAIQPRMMMDLISDKIYGVSIDFNIISHGGIKDIQTEYKSSKSDVIEVNKETGKATIVGVGSTTISATKPGNGKYKLATVSQEVTVKEGSQGDLIIIPITTKTYGDSDFQLTYTGGEGTGDITYTSDNQDVVIVDENGLISIKGAGTATVTVTKAGDDNYQAAEASKVVTVNQKSVYIKPDSKKIIAGQQIPVLTYTIEGLVKGDKCIVKPILKADVKDTNRIGIYRITAEDAEIENIKNYTIIYKLGILTISPVSVIDNSWESDNSNNTDSDDSNDTTNKDDNSQHDVVTGTIAQSIELTMKGLTVAERAEVQANILACIPYTWIDTKIYTEKEIEWIYEYTNGIFTKEQLQYILEDLERLELLGIDEDIIRECITIESAEKITFTDVTEVHWAKNAIEESAALGFAKGMPEGTFLPNQTIKIEDAQTFLDRVMLVNNQVPMKQTRKDVEEHVANTTHWAFSHRASISSKLSTETLEGIQSVESQPVSRGLLAQMLYELTNGELEKVYPVGTFTDIAQSAHKEAIEYCVQTGLLNGMSATKMAPEATVKRSELMAMLIRLNDALK